MTIMVAHIARKCARRVEPAVVLLGLCIAAQPAAAAATEYLTEVNSDVYQAAGTPKELATRASICISKQLAAGSTEAQLIISADLDGGTIVARNALKYGMLGEWEIRSRFTFEARNGRFRIEQTGLERLNLTGGGWLPIGKWPGSGWQKAQDMFAASAGEIAKCVTAAPETTSW